MESRASTRPAQCSSACCRVASNAALAATASAPSRTRRVPLARERDDGAACGELGQADSLQAKGRQQFRGHGAGEIVRSTTRRADDESRSGRVSRAQNIAGDRQPIGSERGNVDAKSHVPSPACAGHPEQQRHAVVRRHSSTRVVDSGLGIRAVESPASTIVFMALSFRFATEADIPALLDLQLAVDADQEQRFGQIAGPRPSATGASPAASSSHGS